MAISYQELPRSEDVRGTVIAVSENNRVIGEIVRVDNGYQFVPLGARLKPELCSEVKNNIEEIKRMLES